MRRCEICYHGLREFIVIWYDNDDCYADVCLECARKIKTKLEEKEEENEKI